MPSLGRHFDYDMTLIRFNNQLLISLSWEWINYCVKVWLSRYLPYFTSNNFLKCTCHSWVKALEEWVALIFNIQLTILTQVCWPEWQIGHHDWKISPGTFPLVTASAQNSPHFFRACMLLACDHQNKSFWIVRGSYSGRGVVVFRVRLTEVLQNAWSTTFVWRAQSQSHDFASFLMWRVQI